MTGVLARRSVLLFFSLSLLLYIVLSFYQLNLPGLHYDEAFEAVPALRLLLGQPVTAFRGSSLIIGGWSLPLMTQDYIGALNTYLAMPFIALLGPTPTALRTMSVMVGLVTLGLSYLLAYQLTGQRWVGLVTAWLLAVEPTFIFWNRQGVFVTAITAPIGLAATYCWLRRVQGETAQTVDIFPSTWPKLRWSLAGAFLLGLGLYAKFLFLWLIAALFGALLLLKLGWFVRRLSPTELLLAGLAFLLGCSPLVLYNLQTGGTWLSITQNAAISYYGVNNLAFGSNLLDRLGQLIIFLNGGHLWYLGQVVNNLWAPVAFGLVLFSVVLVTLRHHSASIEPAEASTPARGGVETSAGQGEAKRQLRAKVSTSCLRLPPATAALLPLLIIGLVVLASVATVSALWITHFAILMPWPAIALAVGTWFVASTFSSSSISRPGVQPGVQTSVWPWRTEVRTPGYAQVIKFGLWFSLGLLLITNLVSVIRYHLALTESGGLSSHSDAIYDLSAWLEQHAQGPVVAMDWGLAAPITYLSEGRVTPTEIFGYVWQSDVQLETWLEGFVAQPATLYLWRAPNEIIFDRSAEFKALYGPKNLEETIEEAFYERSGRPLLGVTRLVQKGTATNPPK